jgi:hypothetical protein
MRARDELDRGPGIFELLDQNKVWVSADGRVTPLEEMNVRHRRNLILWLVKNAHSIKFRYELYLTSGPGPSGEMACDAYEQGMQALMDIPDDIWINETKLMRRLRKLERQWNR